jgi:hypothetical protein
VLLGSGTDSDDSALIAAVEKLQLPRTVQGTQEPPSQFEVEILQTEWTGRWLCICQQAGFWPNPPLRLNRDRHPEQSQLFAGLLPFKFSGCPAAGCPIRSSQFPDSGRSAKLGFFELDSSEPDVGDLTQSARSGQRPTNGQRQQRTYKRRSLERKTPTKRGLKCASFNFKQLAFASVW